MNLDETQRQKVAAWIREGLKLSEIQTRLASELGVRATYMDVRLLVDDLKLTPKDIEPPKRVQNIGNPPPSDPAAARGPSPKLDEETPPSAGRITLSVDQLARPGALVSGKVVFSDGQQAEWYLDQAGRLGIVPKQQGYKPAAMDLQEFQLALQDELAKQGF